MTTGTNAGLFLLGRLIFGGYFLYNGLNHFMSTDMLAAYAASAGVPMPTLAVLFTGVLMLVGGIAFLTGVWPKLGAASLGLFLVGVTPIMHAFWLVSDPQAQMAELGNFTKNMALLGGVFITASIPQPWPLSFASRSEDVHGRQAEAWTHAEQRR
jgi:uncharacterized membrane protein YphA (DoxX/SURF4 family)